MLCALDCAGGVVQHAAVGQVAQAHVEEALGGHQAAVRQQAARHVQPLTGRHTAAKKAGLMLHWPGAVVRSPEGDNWQPRSNQCRIPQGAGTAARGGCQLEYSAQSQTTDPGRMPAIRELQWHFGELHAGRVEHGRLDGWVLRPARSQTLCTQGLSAWLCILEG
jgi:hypothetical protein